MTARYTRTSSTNTLWLRERSGIKNQSYNLEVSSQRGQSSTNEPAAETAHCHGQKKCTSNPIPNAYKPAYVEAEWYDWWEKQGFFSPMKSSDIGTTAYTMIIPPPNVTGTLHLGHALTNAVQDALIRWHRMQGNQTLWLPGCDHAGIATQVVVEKKLSREQRVSRHELGRDAFIEEVWKWKHSKGNRIYEQLKRLGSSLDWQRAYFTMDQKLSTAVTEAFVRLHDEGLIYRKTRLVNWSCALKSAISDIEVDNRIVEEPTTLAVPGYDKKVEFGVLDSFAYTIKDTDEEVVVATTRLETMLGDTAIAVNPDDDRYRHLQGKHAIHPFCDRLVPIICDSHVDKAFGTGAVKITPAHDYNDYEIGERRRLQTDTVLNEDGHIAQHCGMFAGMRRFDARSAVREQLKKQGLYRGSKKHSMVLPICSRSGDIIEPLLKPQWYINCQEMAAHAVDAVRSGELHFVPSYYEKTWFEWLGKIRDWCISRQLWWGHRVPAYRVLTPTSHREELWVSGRSEEEARRRAARKTGMPVEHITLEQDEDVLDTWFSSALLPFSSLGWPDQTKDLQSFYPLSLMETGHDILFFWVARMVMLGTKLTGQLPFNEVLMHGLVCDAQGRKMSKSLGNIIDPLDVVNGISLQDLHRQVEQSNLSKQEVELAKKGQKQNFPAGIPECGSDALRFALCSHNIKSDFINVDVSQIHSYRLFCNKIWQAFRFMQMAVGPDDIIIPHPSVCSLSNVDWWILSRLHLLVKTCNEAFKAYEIHRATRALHQFWYGDFCDVYLECVKPVLYKESAAEASSDEEAEHREAIRAVRSVLCHCIDTGLRAIAPFMPYLAEELYQRLAPSIQDPAASVCVAPYPRVEEYESFSNSRLEEEMQFVLEVAKHARAVRTEYNLTKTRADLYVEVSDSSLLGALHSTSARTSEQQAATSWLLPLQTLSFSRSVTLLTEATRPSGCVQTIVNNNCQIFTALKGLVDVDKERERYDKKISKLCAEINKTTKRLVEKRLSEDQRLKLSDKKSTLETKLGHVHRAVANLESIS
ncbi:PREDICTED: valine--tRNA ligase-like isoform X2 [Priapulus caudatus]|nr:PREDICTED: valine--tRNA ligase-like isoform X2 [Priapulus caudatus]